MNINITFTEKDVSVRHEREPLSYIHERDLRVLIIELRDYIESCGGWIHCSIKAGLHSKINILEDYVAGEDITVPYKEEKKK